VLHEARVISSSLAKIAEVIVDEIWDQHFAGGQSQQDALSEMAGNIDIARMEDLLLGLLRRQLVAAIYRRQALRDESVASEMSAAVGFADLVGYTSLSQSLSGAELTRLVVAFEETTFDLVAEMKGRVVKTIGDEVMFAFEDAIDGADFALRLARLAGVRFPAVRVGLCWGPVLNRQGDCFGPTVNLASRFVGLAGGGEVLVDSALANALPRSRFAIEPLGVRDIKGFGSVEAYRLAAT
jgi:adenylate cyclase